jgi:hypothetical protein
MRPRCITVLLAFTAGCSAVPSPEPAPAARQADPEPRATDPRVSETRPVVVYEYRPNERDVIVNASGTLTFLENDDADTSAVAAQLGAGYFLTNEHELGAQLLTTWTDTDDGAEATSYFFGPYYNYNFHVHPRTTLYAGPHFGIGHLSFEAGSVDDSDTVLAFGLHAGLRQWLTEDVAFNVEPRWTHADFDNDLGGDTDSIDILFGFSVLF